MSGHTRCKCGTVVRPGDWHTCPAPSRVTCRECGGGDRCRDCSGRDRTTLLATMAATIAAGLVADDGFCVADVADLATSVAELILDECERRRTGEG